MQNSSISNSQFTNGALNTNGNGEGLGNTENAVYNNDSVLAEDMEKMLLASNLKPQQVP